jgi:hypothetical protein
MFYAIEHAYGAMTINNGPGGRADRVLEFTSRRLRDAWVDDGTPYASAPGYRSKAGAREPIVRRADWKDDGDSEAWEVLARRRVEDSPKLQQYRWVLLDYDWCCKDHFRWVARNPERELIEWAEYMERCEFELAEAE